MDARVELGAEGSEVTALHVRPALVVFRRTHDEWIHVLLHLHEVFIEVVQEFSLLVGLGTFARDVIEEHGKRAHAQVVHLLELADEVCTVFIVPLDVLARVDSPHEVHFVLLGHFHQLLQLLGFLFRIRQAPVRRAVVRVILRTIDIGVHLVLAIELQVAKTCFVAPWSTIETFHHPTEADFRIVSDFSHWQLLVLQELGKGLYGIEGASLVVTGQHEFLRADADEVAFLLGRDEFLVFVDSLVSTFADHDAEACLVALFGAEHGFQDRYGTRIGFVQSVELVRAIEHDHLGGFFRLLRCGLHISFLCMDSHARHQAKAG